MGPYLGGPRCRPSWPMPRAGPDCRLRYLESQYIALCWSLWNLTNGKALLRKIISTFNSYTNMIAFQNTIWSVQFCSPTLRSPLARICSFCFSLCWSKPYFSKFIFLGTLENIQLNRISIAASSRSSFILFKILDWKFELIDQTLTNIRLSWIFA